MKSGIKSIHDIPPSYVTSNTYFLTFMILGVNTFMMPGVNHIYELIIQNRFTCLFINLPTHF